MHHQDHSLITFAQRQHEEIIFPVALIDVINKIPVVWHIVIFQYPFTGLTKFTG